MSETTVEHVFEDLNPERVVFHFNKAHNTDPQNIPAWTVKHKGKTFYVHHLDSEVGFRTKESPESEHTKGALQFKGRLRIVEKTEAENLTRTAYVW